VNLFCGFSLLAEKRQRRGKPVVLVVEAGRMHAEGNAFYRSENGVWLTEAVPARYLRLPESAAVGED
jgi:putative RNA 2'-phosphotransferase